MKRGTIGAVYIMTYSIGRFVLEFFRGDLERGSVGSLSTSQFISIFTLVAGVVLFFYRRKKDGISGIHLFIFRLI